ncbi:MAG: hypothetical protein RSG52_03490 [Terrisporobacter sp.]|uniref:hypothetical protein n=1 Tax=Terrisporobacter sp. TaxID=1965305 RepID=UPI002FC5E781
MKKRTLVFITLIFLLMNINNSVKCLSKNDIIDSSQYSSTINNNLNIRICESSVVNDKLKLDRVYNTYAIITMEIFNTGLEDIELSNINTYAYQDNKEIATFIKSENDECLGFVGTLNSGESKIIKIGVGLHEKNIPLELVFENSPDLINNKCKKIINL